MKKAIIIGHNRLRKGAYSPFLQVSEFDFFNEMKEELSQSADVYEHDASISSYRHRMLVTASRINMKDYDCIFALHFNSFHDSRASGVEALVFHKNMLSHTIADKLCRSYSELSGIPLRRTHVVPISEKTQRGYYEIAMPKAPVVLFEPFFGSSPLDCEKVKSSDIIKVLREIT